MSLLRDMSRPSPYRTCEHEVQLQENAKSYAFKEWHKLRACKLHRLEHADARRDGEVRRDRSLRLYIRAADGNMHVFAFIQTLTMLARRVHARLIAELAWPPRMCTCEGTQRCTALQQCG